MPESKAEGAEFLKVVGKVVMALGIIAAVVLTLSALGSRDYAYFAYAVSCFVGSAVVYGVCINLASINNSTHRVYLLKFKEYKQEKDKDFLNFKDMEV